jgi:hypothetical protein
MSLLKHLEQEAAYLLSELKKLAASHNSAYGDHDDRLKAIIGKLDEHVESTTPAPVEATPVAAPVEAPAPVVAVAPVADPAPATPVVAAPADTTPVATPAVDTTVAPTTTTTN